MNPLSGDAKRVRTMVLAIALVVIAAVRMATTFRVYSQTVDEATHVGAGLELLQSHRYTIQNENPPLPRVIWAGLARAAGMRIDQSKPEFHQQLLSVFGHENYRGQLFIVRTGSLLFYILACIAIFVATREEFGDRAALIALFVFTMEPIVLGYCGLATHDAPATAAVAMSLLAFTRWLRGPGIVNAVAVGAAYGFGVLCKFSCIAFVPAACAAIWIIRLLHDRRHRWIREAATLIAIVAVTTPIVIWAGYGFTSHDFFAGIRGLMRIEDEGVRSYLNGEVSTHGWFWYFPITLGLKTTLTFFVLFAVAAWCAFRRSDSRWHFLEFTVPGFAMLALCMPSTLDLGVRYVLPIFVPFAMAIGAGLDILFRDATARTRVAMIILIVVHSCVSLLAHPDYFPYFNAFAGRDPSRYVIDSNLDWGQDLLRLRSALRREHADKVAISLLAVFDYDGQGFPTHTNANPWQPTTGWVAVSDYSYRMTFVEGGWRWLETKPYRRVGKSIRLFHFP